MHTHKHTLLMSATLMSALLLGACQDQTAQQNADANADTPQTVATQPAAAPQPVLAVNESRALREERVACITCGTIRSITAVNVEGQASGAGTVIGAIVGGLAGSQVGGGSGKKIATVAGAVGGAVAGNTIEKRRNGEQWFEIVIAMDDGSQQLISVPDASGLTVGSAVSVQGSQIQLR